MPTYEYRCKDCNHQFDAVQAFTDNALSECPVCGGALKKVFGSVGITFKGSGFYKTDSRAGAAKSDNGDKSPEKVGASTDGASSKDGSANGSSGKDGAASSSSDSGKGGSGTSDSGKSSKGDSKAGDSASKAVSKSGS
jgi:putative FmdB family regulatory protein